MFLIINGNVTALKTITAKPISVELLKNSFKILI